MYTWKKRTHSAACKPRWLWRVYVGSFQAKNCWVASRERKLLPPIKELALERFFEKKKKNLYPKLQVLQIWIGIMAFFDWHHNVFCLCLQTVQWVVLIPQVEQVTFYYISRHPPLRSICVQSTVFQYLIHPRHSRFKYIQGSDRLPDSNFILSKQKGVR